MILEKVPLHKAQDTRHSSEKRGGENGGSGEEGRGTRERERLSESTTGHGNDTSVVVVLVVVDLVARPDFVTSTIHLHVSVVRELKSSSSAGSGAETGFIVVIGFIVLLSFFSLNLRPCGGGLALFLLAPVGSDDIVPGCVVYVGTGMSLEFSGTYGVGLIMVELDGAVETLDVSRFLWVLDLGP